MEEENIIKIPEEIKENFYKKWEKNPMLVPKIGKVTVNISVGESGAKLEKASQVLETLVDQTPVKCQAKKTIRGFGIRKYEPIAIKTTLRGEKAIGFLKRALEVVENKLKKTCFDKFGNFGFGIKEHIEIPGVKYDPAFGIFGMDITVSMERKGFRIHRRSYRRKKIPNRTRIKPDETMVFMEKNYGLTLIKEYIISYY